MTIAINENEPKTTCKYEATVKPQGKDSWRLTIEDVRYFTSEPDVVYTRSVVFNQDTYQGTEEEVRAYMSDKIRALVADREAANSQKAFTITEDEVEI